MKLRPHPLIIFSLAALVIFLFYKSTPKSSEDLEKATSSKNPTSTTISTPPPSQQIDPTNTDPRFTRFLDGRIHWQASFTTSRKLHQSPDPQSDLHLVDQLLSAYRLVFKENPVGTDNAEIVAYLLGDNPKKVTFVAPDSPALSATGELIDRWGSPYIFHPLTSDRMDIRSLGPDRKLWTADDLTLGQEKTKTHQQ